ncbi:hypothetical protein AB0Q95_04885 [Streptomyces sp. NPDC059900]|uniref:hypothetical protein n=1 Tax=Streptomyces sp. NPDC059900 TaxID=3155816 RepID=UPI003435B63F
MSEPNDALRSLFHEAADRGQAQAGPAPFAQIAERGRRSQRRRRALVVLAACLVLGGGGAAAVTLLPGDPAPVPPANTPSQPAPSPMDTAPPPSSTPANDPSRFPSHSATTTSPPR